MKLSLMLLVLVFSAPGFLHADLVRFQNEEIDGQKAMEALSFDQSAKSNNGMRFWPFNGRQYYVIQLTDVAQESWKNELALKGVELSHYVPDNAFIAKVPGTFSGAAWEALNKASYVKAVFPYKTSLRLSQSLTAPSVFTKSATEKITIKLLNPEDAANVKLQLQNKGVELFDSYSDKVFTAEVPVNSISDIADVEGIEWVEPLAEIHTMEFDFDGKIGPFGNMPPVMEKERQYKDLTGYESGTKLMNFQAAWNKGYHGEGEVVALGDSGLDLGSTTNILADFKGQVVRGYALGFMSSTWNDAIGHGTHTAGSVAGSGVTSGGVLKGGAYRARIVEESLSSSVLGGAVLGTNLETLFVNVFKNDGVHIHSDSWGSNHQMIYDSLAVSVDEIVWKNPELLVVFAAGNSGADLNQDGRIDPGSVESPATAKNCLSVGASKNYVLTGGIQREMKESKSGSKYWPVEPLASAKLSDNPNGMAPFSSTGPTQDGRIKPDIVAPGTNIVSARSQDPKAEPLWGPFNKYYVYSGGTSMATPLAAGAAAVTRQYAKKVLGRNPSAATVKALLIHTAHDLYPGQYGTGAYHEFDSVRPNNNEGFGRVDMANMVNGKFYFADERSGLKTGYQAVYTAGLQKVLAGHKVRATLVYTDAPGTASAAQALVNDLDLSVVDPAGNIHYPNHLNGPDKKNNVEMVEFDAPVAGSYKVFVKGANVPTPGAFGGQSFSVVWEAM